MNESLRTYLRFGGLLILATWMILLFLVIKPRARKAVPPPPGFIPSNSIFHRPAGHACPHGTKLLSNFFFNDRDGTTADACHNPNGDGSIDYLNPGEGVHQVVPLTARPEEKSKT